MIDFIDVYTNKSSKYDQLVSKEDVNTNLLKAITEIIPLEDLTIAEFGAGTGRLSFQMAKLAKQVYSFDISPQMINTANVKQKLLNIPNINFSVSDHFSVPLSNNSVDLSIEAWAFLAMKLHSNKPITELFSLAINEMKRVLKPDHPLILIETLGTCYDEPKSKILNAEINKFLENDLGFTRKIIRTDFEFDSISEALDLMSFFFGEEAVTYIKEHQSTVIPECTGVWWKLF
jgi:ubiquinone/menaquinone biosynthesis C-methylase UbiE